MAGRSFDVSALHTGLRSTVGELQCPPEGSRIDVVGVATPFYTVSGPPFTKKHCLEQIPET